MSSESTSKVAEGFPKIDRHREPSPPRPVAVSSSERRSTPASPLSSGQVYL